MFQRKARRESRPRRACQVKISRGGARERLSVRGGRVPPARDGRPTGSPPPAPPPPSCSRAVWERRRMLSGGQVPREFFALLDALPLLAKVREGHSAPCKNSGSSACTCPCCSPNQAQETPAPQGPPHLPGPPPPPGHPRAPTSPLEHSGLLGLPLCLCQALGRGRRLARARADERAFAAPEGAAFVYFQLSPRVPPPRGHASGGRAADSTAVSPVSEQMAGHLGKS